jgi:hypothetical protein
MACGNCGGESVSTELILIIEITYLNLECGISIELPVTIIPVTIIVQKFFHASSVK